MRVSAFTTTKGQLCYIVTNEDGQIIAPIARYIRFLSNVGYKPNSLRAKAFGLSAYFDYCHRLGLDVKYITLDEMAGFVHFLKNPYHSTVVFPFVQSDSARSPRTINSIMAAVGGFYDYLWRTDAVEINYSEKTSRAIPARFKTFKNFLHHITKGQDIKTSIFHQKTPRRTNPPTISKEATLTLFGACENNRDRMLVTLLFETGMRIGEVIGLKLKDIDAYELVIHVVDRGTSLHGASTKTAESVRDLDVAQPLMNLILIWIAEEHPIECNHDYLFINLKGKNKHQPMNYWSVVSLFRRLKRKTGIDANAHLFRHTHLTLLAESEWRPEEIQKRAGHKNYQTTFDTYIHPSDSSLHEAWCRTKQMIALHDEVDTDDKH